MDIESPTTEAAAETTTPAAATTSCASAASASRAHLAIESLLSIVTTIPPHIASDDDPAHALLHNQEVASQISDLLRQPRSGAGDNPLCRWLYDTFQTTDPALQLVVLRYLPTISGIYLSRVAHDRSFLIYQSHTVKIFITFQNMSPWKSDST